MGVSENSRAAAPAGTPAPNAASSTNAKPSSSTYSPYSELHTGDIFLMNRKCLAMRDPLGITLCLLTKLECPYDHVAMLVKLPESERHKYPKSSQALNEAAAASPSDMYVLETNRTGVTLRSLETRVDRSSANAIAVRLLCTERESPEEVSRRILTDMENLYGRPYRESLLEFIPSMFVPPDKVDRIRAAHALNLLSKELKLMHEFQNTQNRADSPAAHATVDWLTGIYTDAYKWIHATYLPKLPLEKTSDGLPVVNFDAADGKGYLLDGANDSRALFCAELIVQLWQGAGLLTSYPKASTFRVFDFLHDWEFNFVSPGTRLSSVILLKEKKNKIDHPEGDVTSHRRTSSPAIQSSVAAAVANVSSSAPVSDTAAFMAHRMRVFSSIALDADEETVSQYRDRRALDPTWLVQTSNQSLVMNNLPWRILCSGILFTAGGFVTAPLAMRALESQVGILLRNGSVWSLACGMAVRNTAFFLSQSTVAAAMVWYRRKKHSDDDSLVMSTQPAFGGIGDKWVDLRHPFYSFLEVWALSAVAAHIISTPFTNRVMAYHFGPPRPAAPPLRMMMRGCFSLSAISILLPYPGAWLAMHETYNSFMIPTPTSYFRSREDLVAAEGWQERRLKHVALAFATMTAVDLAAYPLQSYVWRGLMRTLYRPAASPSYGRRIFGGYRYRFAANLVTLTCTMSYLHASDTL